MKPRKTAWLEDYCDRNTEYSTATLVLPELHSLSSEVGWIFSAAHKMHKHQEPCVFPMQGRFSPLQRELLLRKAGGCLMCHVGKCHHPKLLASEDPRRWSGFMLWPFTLRELGSSQVRNRDGHSAAPSSMGKAGPQERCHSSGPV